MKTLAVAFVCGLIFGCGILLSGMANPAKILNFFDIAGSWDPSLAFVMLGAIPVAAVGYRLAWRRPAPVLGATYLVPANRTIDARLVTGSAIFGIGWGIAGFCPGGALPAVGLMRADVLIYVVALALGLLLSRAVDIRLANRREAAARA